MKMNFWIALSALGLLVTQSAMAVESVTYRQIGAVTTAVNDSEGGLHDGEVAVDAVPTHADVFDFSASGLDLGTAGYWFFNFNASANTGSAPEANEVEALPSWVTVDKVSADPTVRTLSNGTNIASSNGGQGYDTLTLPEASGPLTGESGALIVQGSAGDSKNAWQSMFLTADTPDQFLMHVVLDNTNGSNDTDRRLKFRGKDENGFEINMRLNNLSGSSNGNPTNGDTDVYTFIMNGWGDGDELRMQIRGFGGFNDRSIAGIMFDVIPEPTSFVLLGLGSMGLLCVRKRQS